MTQLDIDFVRAQFPAFSDPDLDGWAFFENAGGSFPCRQTIGRLVDFYRHSKVQPHHPYPLARRAGEAMDAGPARLAPWLGADPDELHVGPSTTQNCYVLAHAFRSILSDGDAIVVTEQDHEANSGAWRRLADTGIEVREWKVDPETGVLDGAGLDDLLDDRVRIVAFPHVSNVVGDENPVREWTDTIHDAGALAVVDGVAAAPHGLPDFGQLGCDVYLFSTYKTYGPHQGVMLVRRELTERLPNQGHFFNEAILAKRLVPAGPDHAQVAALGGIVDYLEALDDHHFGNGGELPADQRNARVVELWRDHERALLGPLLDFLSAHDGFRVIGPTDPKQRMPTVAIAGPRPAAQLAEALADHGIMAGAGHFYAYRAVEAVGIDPGEGVLRVSFVHNTSREEIDQLIEALDQVS
ncbi:MAG: aminotransferase class V-fold PLP-dependent enzyme [Nitriliruptorales bacterium]|nr:aminotransferase class V-fold PLP-dependent enzyme [Nitriliruptorales bacterium]